MTAIRALVIAFVLAATTGVAAAGDYAAGNEAYKQGDYSTAVREYEALVAEGIVHENLFYNLGNAYFRGGRLGPAIFNYERALRIEPAFEDARYNLAVAREVVAERVVDRLKGAEQDPMWVRVATYFSVAELTVAFLVLNGVFFLLLVILRFRSEGFARTATKVTTVFVGVALAASLVLLNRHIYVLERVHQGIVLADQVFMREGADDSLAERGQLHPGIRVRILDRKPGWLRIELSNGVEGWVRQDAIGEL